MKIQEGSNVLRFPREGSGQGKGKEDATDHGKAGSTMLAQSVLEQAKAIERAIDDAESARSAISASAIGASAALRRFEQTLVNLRLSLENQRSAATEIESAARAGYAAALLKAQIIGSGGLAIRCHSNVSPSNVGRACDLPLESEWSG